MSASLRLILECNEQKTRKRPAIGAENNSVCSRKDFLIRLDGGTSVMSMKTAMYLHQTPTLASVINLPISQGLDWANNQCVG